MKWNRAWSAMVLLLLLVMIVGLLPTFASCSQREPSPSQSSTPTATTQTPSATNNISPTSDPTAGADASPSIDVSPSQDTSPSPDPTPSVSAAPSVKPATSSDPVGKVPKPGPKPDSPSGINVPEGKRTGRLPPVTAGEKVVYLTFDDGPHTKVTPKVLDILAKYDIKGTFFMLGVKVDENPTLAKRVADEGHVIAHHSYSHVYDKLTNLDNFLAELDKTEQALKRATGSRQVGLFRFPGGMAKTDAFVQNLSYRGYTAYRWNCVSNDSLKVTDPAKALAMVKETAQGKSDVTVLMHDTYDVTYEILEDTIKYFKEQGYTFKTMPKLDLWEQDMPYD